MIGLFTHAWHALGATGKSRTVHGSVKLLVELAVKLPRRDLRLMSKVLSVEFVSLDEHM